LRGVSESYRGKHVRIFRLDRAGVLARLRAAAARLLAARDDVVQVRLFGSLARGDAVPGSDADLLLVVRDTDARFVDRSVALARFFEGAGVGCDVLVYTEAEVARLATVPSVVKAAMEEGIVLAERDSASP